MLIKFLAVYQSGGGGGGEVTSWRNVSPCTGGKKPVEEYWDVTAVATAAPANYSEDD